MVSGNETIEDDDQRIEKTGVTPPQGVQLGNFTTEAGLLAIDSAPVLKKNTVRIESVTPTEDDHYEITISGEKR